MRYKAVVFDLDGTLLDTIDDLTDSMNATLARFGFAQHTVDECKLFVGDGVEMFVRRALPPGKEDPDTVARVSRAYLGEYGRRWADKTRPYDGIPELLQELHRRGMKLAVFSNKPQDVTTLTVAKFLPGIRFDAVVGARQGVPHKPDPTGALEIAAQLGVQPAEVVYVGDTNTDMQTAAAAGFFAVGALWGFRSAAELTGNGAMALIEKPSDIIRLL